MSFGIGWMVKFSVNFLNEAKKLEKKYKQLKSDLKYAVKEIEKEDIGVYLGNNLYKKRVKNSSIPTGKSGGFRVIIYTKVKDDIVLISIYAKTQKEILSDDEIRVVLNKYLKSDDYE